MLQVCQTPTHACIHVSMHKTYMCMHAHLYAHNHASMRIRHVCVCLRRECVQASTRVAISPGPSITLHVVQTDSCVYVLCCPWPLPISLWPSTPSLLPSSEALSSYLAAYFSLCTWDVVRLPRVRLHVWRPGLPSLCGALPYLVVHGAKCECLFMSYSSF
jgi:hypothetical protein